MQLLLGYKPKPEPSFAVDM